MSMTAKFVALGVFLALAAGLAVWEFSSDQNQLDDRAAATAGEDLSRGGAARRVPDPEQPLTPDLGGSIGAGAVPVREDREVPVVKSPANAALHGTVRDAHGQPVAGAMVIVGDPGLMKCRALRNLSSLLAEMSDSSLEALVREEWHTIETDEQGGWRLDEIDFGGRWSVAALHPEHSAAIRTGLVVAAGRTRASCRPRSARRARDPRPGSRARLRADRRRAHRSHRWQREHDHAARPDAD